MNRRAEMKIVTVIQARMLSQRLPGKVLMPLSGRPMLLHVLNQVERCEMIDAVVVSTSNDASDKPVTAFCDNRGTPCYAGPLDNVAQRLMETILYIGFQLVFTQIVPANTRSRPHIYNMSVVFQFLKEVWNPWAKLAIPTDNCVVAVKENVHKIPRHPGDSSVLSYYSWPRMVLSTPIIASELAFTPQHSH